MRSRIPIDPNPAQHLDSDPPKAKKSRKKVKFANPQTDETEDQRDQLPPPLAGCLSEDHRKLIRIRTGTIGFQLFQFSMARSMRRVVSSPVTPMTLSVSSQDFPMASITAIPFPSISVSYGIGYAILQTQTPDVLASAARSPRGLPERSSLPG